MAHSGMEAPNTECLEAVGEILLSWLLPALMVPL